MTNLQLIIVDPQNDFCIADDFHGNKGMLVVPGASGDIARLTKMIDRLSSKLTDIHVTLDSHQTIGIERPKWWKRASDGAEPVPFTCLGVHPDGRRIVKFDFAPGPVPTEEEYVTFVPSHFARSLDYLKKLAANGRYPHIVWTEHCIVGTWGWSIVPELAAALGRGERAEYARVNYVVKGNNPWTEHFSAVKAEVEDPSDPGTQMNTRLIQTLEEADVVLVSGEALSHCVANTGKDIASAFSNPKYIEKLVLLTDASSNVATFDWLGDAFINDLKSKGMRLETTKTYLV